MAGYDGRQRLCRLAAQLSGTMGLGEEEKIPLILLVRWNTPCIKKLGLALDLLAQREIAVVGVILTDADARFLHAYYRV